MTNTKYLKVCFCESWRTHLFACFDDDPLSIPKRVSINFKGTFGLLNFGFSCFFVQQLYFSSDFRRSPFTRKTAMNENVQLSFVKEFSLQSIESCLNDFDATRVVLLKAWTRVILLVVD